MFNDTMKIRLWRHDRDHTHIYMTPKKKPNNLPSLPPHNPPQQFDC
jgi:hypothetical protein